MNNDGVINAYDVTKIGRGDVPSLIYGAGFTVSYLNFSVGAFFRVQAGLTGIFQVMLSSRFQPMAV
ncbi:hypothetical protein ACQ86K_08115 [Mucilaginibacter sp. P19]|uniref:hypothetical protein n=1 Tax=Mucilaginibacter sp. P19 TaxID=3423947 RepID=UPI003D676399